MTGTKVALAFVMEGGTGRLFVNGAEEASRPFSAGGGTPIGTASLEAVILGGNLFDAATGAFNGTIDRFRAFTFDRGQFEAGQLLGPDDGSNDFTGWIDRFDVGGQSGFADDPDGDRLANGLENFFGTDPGVTNAGFAAVSSDGTGLSFQHPQNVSPANDVTGSYEWSLDLTSFHPTGATVGGTTVQITPTLSDPIPGTTTVAATVTGTIPDQLFLRVAVTQGA